MSDANKKRVEAPTGESVLMAKWEEVDGHDTCRMAVPGGWLYRADEEGSFCMVFVPEPPTGR